nr:hypothetical protein [Tanacetum cinerariifolium]
VVTSRFPTTNNQLRNSSNPRKQATINDGRVIVQPVHGRQSSFAMGINSHEQNAEIDRLKQTLSEQLQEKESLMNIVTVLKDDFKKEEYRNIDREIALEKKIKHQDNIVYNRDQLAQTVHMLTKPKFFYDHTTKQALGFQNPFYLKKAQQLEPKLYDGNVIKNTCAIVIPDSEETTMLAEESHSKMLLKQQDPMVLEKKVNTTPVDYAVLNQLSQDFEKQFVPQTKLSAEQAFWSQNFVNSSYPIPSNRPTKVKVPKELPKVSMVNTSLKKLKHHLAGFDVVFKKRSTATSITEGTWGFEHTKACFRDKIIPFVKALKDIFNTFDQYLIDELAEVQNVFHQMKQDDIVNIVVNSSVDNAVVNMHECKECLKLETALLNKKDFIEKDTYDKLFRRYTMLEKHCISLEVDTQLNQEIFQRDNFVSNQSAPSFDQYFELNELKVQSQEKDTVISKLKERIKSLSGNMDKDKVKKDIKEIETINIKLDHRVSKLIAKNEHLKQTYKQLYDSIKSKRVRSNEKCDALINQVNLKSVEISDLNTNLQEQGLIIAALKDELKKLNEKAIVDNIVTTHTIDPEMLKVDVEPIAPRLLNNKTVQSNYLRLTQERAAILKKVVKQEKSQNPLNNSLDHACKYTKRIQELLILIRQTCPSINNSSNKLVVVTPTNKDKRVRFAEPITSSGNTNKKTTSSSNLVPNKPMLSSTGVKPSTSASGSQPSGNTKKNKIQRPPSSTQKNKQNGVTERHNCTLIEAAHTMLIYAKAPLFLWAEAVATACYTQNRSIIRLRYGKTPYELLHNKPPDLSFLHVFGTLCYPTNDSENLGKLQPKANIGIFIGYAPTKKAFQIYNRHTRRTIKIIHVDFDELTAMASKHSSSKLALYKMTPATISSGLMPNSPSSTSFVPPSRTDWDLLFQPLFDELLTPPPSVVNLALEVIAPIAEVVAPKPATSTSSPSSTTVDQDIPSPSNSQTTPETQTLIISNDVEEDNHDLDVAHMHNDSFFGFENHQKHQLFMMIHFMNLFKKTRLLKDHH